MAVRTLMRHGANERLAELHFKHVEQQWKMLPWP